MPRNRVSDAGVEKTNNRALVDRVKLIMDPEISEFSFGFALTGELI
jgi:hypothetical protein